MTLLSTIIAAVFAGANYILGIYLFVLFAHVILAFVKADPSNSVVRFIAAVCEPPCRYLLNRFPRLMIQGSGGYIDLSPVTLMLGIGCVRILLGYLHDYFRAGGAGF